MKMIFKFFTLLFIFLLTSCETRVKVDDIFKLGFDNKKEIESLFNDENFDKNIFKEDLIDLTKDINELTIYNSLEYAKVHYSYFSNFDISLRPFPTVNETFIYIDKINCFGITEIFSISDISEWAGNLSYNGYYIRVFTKLEKESDYSKSIVLDIDFKIVGSEFSQDTTTSTFDNYSSYWDNEMRLNLTYVATSRCNSFNINSLLTTYNISDIKVNSVDESYKIFSTFEEVDFKTVYDMNFKELYTFANGNIDYNEEDYNFTFFIAREYKKSDYIIEDINFDSKLSFYTSSYFPNFSSEMLFN